MAADDTYWKTVIFPIMLTIVGASVGIAELHCACVAKNGKGVLLAGPSGAGKSTLALSLAQTGFHFLSDDRTFCSLENEQVQAWGLPTRLKLRPEASRWFEELHDGLLIDAQTDGRALWLDPDRLADLKRAQRCRPICLIFLEQQQAPEFRLDPMSSAEARDRLTSELMVELPEAAAKRSDTIGKVVETPCWLLRYGGQPHLVARNISHHLGGL